MSELHEVLVVLGSSVGAGAASALANTRAFRVRLRKAEKLAAAALDEVAQLKALVQELVASRPHQERRTTWLMGVVHGLCATLRFPPPEQPSKSPVPTPRG